MGRAQSVVTLTSNHERRTRRAASPLQETAAGHPDVKDVYIIISGCPDTTYPLSPPESPNNCESKSNVAPPSASTSIDSLQYRNQNHYLIRPEKRRSLRRNRPRSSTRLFFIILNLVGVSRNVAPRGARSNIKSTPHWLAWPVGPVGVQPSAILLERLNIESSRRGLKGIVERTERVNEMGESHGITDPLDEPYWFQDNDDGKCLGPSGEFGECGDATLWRVKRRPLSKREAREKRYRDLFRKQRLERSRNQRPLKDSTSVCVWPFFRDHDCRIHHAPHFEYDEIYGFEYSNEESEEAGFALQLMNVDAVTANASLSFGQRGDAKAGSSVRMTSFFGKRTDRGDIDGNGDECLVPIFSSDGSPTRIEVGPCKSPNAYTWQINRDGILVRASTKAERRRRRIRDTLNPIRRAAVASSGGANSMHVSDEFKCVFRSNTTSSYLLPCNEGRRNKSGENSSMVQFSLVRYPTVSKRTSRMTQPSDTQVPSWEPWINVQPPSIGRHDDQTDDEIRSATKNVDQLLPSLKTNSQRHAAGGQKMVDLKPTSSMLRTSLVANQGRPKKNVGHTSASHIRDSPASMNGVAFHDQRLEENKGLKPPSTGKRIRLDRKGRKIEKIVSHDKSFDRRTLESDSRPPHRPRKIPVHSYIQSAKDFIWIDPLTSLAYPTDLCEYLGHKKEESGRHTLTGVGQYYRTAFNIKVYGAAFYVSKRDVLADSKFGEFAALSADELRERDDFYTHLMNMPDPDEDPASTLGGRFDRTLFIKMNMQLSTDAMRKSLEADWSLLTEEMKSTVIGSSLRERQADEHMQAKIQSKENSSNCSCGQLAPDELNADPSCCARGTELVFTWRKNGDFEIRIDGRIMDVFRRPDIAKGIFSEYLNNDPISLDAKARFADGFPFLLAPLAQVKGMLSAVPHTHERPKKSKTQQDRSSNANPVHRFVDAAMNSMGAMNNQAQTLSKWMQESAASASSNAMNSAVDLGRVINSEMKRQRIEIIENALALRNEGVEMLSSLVKVSLEDEKMALALVAMPSFSPYSAGFNAYNQVQEDESETIKYIHEALLESDEIGIRVEPTVNFSHYLFFTSVHAYLFLLLVVSWDTTGSCNSVRRKAKKT